MDQVLELLMSLWTPEVRAALAYVGQVVLTALLVRFGWKPAPAPAPETQSPATDRPVVKSVLGMLKAGIPGQFDDLLIDLGVKVAQRLRQRRQQDQAAEGDAGQMGAK